MKRTAASKSKDNSASVGIRGSLDGKGQMIGIVTARFNSEITSALEKGAVATLIKRGVSPKNIISVSVPGAVEITTAAHALLKSGSIDAIIAIGCVIRGETTHYESVCNAVERGCTHLQLDFGKPVVFGVLTTENMEQALDRVGGHHGHKGEEAADTAIEMVNLVRDLKRVSKTKGRK